MVLGRSRGMGIGIGIGQLVRLQSTKLKPLVIFGAVGAFGAVTCGSYVA